MPAVARLVLPANIAVGHAVPNPSVGVSFPTAGALAIIEVSIVTLQKLQGAHQETRQVVGEHS